MKNSLLLIVFLFWSAGSVSAQGTCFANGTPSNASCQGACTGAMFIVFSGGQLPINLYINGGPPIMVTSVFQQGGLCPGVYDFIAVDANGDTCTGTQSIVVTQLPAPTISVNVVNATCQTCNDGSAMVNVTGGTPPYTYLWSNGATTQSMAGLTVGNYTVTVTDANGCIDQVSFPVGVGSTGFYSLTGEVYLDLNQNGTKDAGESGVSNQVVQVQPLGMNAYTGSSGFYHAIVPAGTYDMNYQVQSGWNLTSLPASYNVTVSTSSLSGFDFGVYPDSTSGSAAVNIASNVPRCNWDVPYYLNLYNNGYTTLDGSLEFTYDASQVFVSSSIVPTSVSGTTLTYDFTGLIPGGVFSPVVTLTEPAAGTPLTTSLVVTATDIFANSVSDTSVLNQVVTCSFDPNDKAVNPPGAGQLNYVAMDTWLNYLIRFQNTGNDTAFKVVILDTLDLNLDINTFTVLGSSHPVSTNISGSRQVSFTFDNILLPDSIVDEPGSHGYVLYRIKGIGSNPDPSMVENTAYIYFDSNAPVQTNTTLSTFSNNWLGIAENNSGFQLQLFPNPMNESVTIKLNGIYTGSWQLIMYDLTGRVVNSFPLSRDEDLVLHRGSLAPGMYLVEAAPVNGGNSKHLRLVVK